MQLVLNQMVCGGRVIEAIKLEEKTRIDVR